MTLDDIGEKWTVVARRAIGSPIADAWRWHLSYPDMAALREDVQVFGGRRFLMATRYDRVNGTVLVAKRRIST